MNKVINRKTDFVFNKDGKQKIYTFKNRLTDLYLDYVLFRSLPSAIASAIYPDFDELDPILNIFSYSYIEFDNTQTILDTSTTMNYDVKSDTLWSTDANIKIGTNNKVMNINYVFDLSAIPNDSLFAGVGFGRDADLETDYLFSFIDVSLASIRTTADTTFGISRYDEITTNEITLTGDGTYLPFIHSATDVSGVLESIILCFDENGTGDEIEYNLSELTLTRLSAGVIEVKGFNNFYISSTGIYPADNLYPSDDLYPIQLGKVKSIKYKYLLSSGGYSYTYVNMLDLDYTYQNTELKIKLICERGEY